MKNVLPPMPLAQTVDKVPARNGMQKEKKKQGASGKGQDAGDLMATLSVDWR